MRSILPEDFTYHFLSSIVFDEWPEVHQDSFVMSKTILSSQELMGLDGGNFVKELERGLCEGVFQDYSQQKIYTEVIDWVVLWVKPLADYGTSYNVKIQ